MVYWVGAAVITPGRYFSLQHHGFRTGGDRGLGLKRRSGAGGGVYAKSRPSGHAREALPAAQPGKQTVSGPAPDSTKKARQP